MFPNCNLLCSVPTHTKAAGVPVRGVDRPASDRPSEEGFHAR